MLIFGIAFPDARKIRKVHNEVLLRDLYSDFVLRCVFEICVAQVRKRRELLLLVTFKEELADNFKVYEYYRMRS